MRQLCAERVGLWNLVLKRSFKKSCAPSLWSYAALAGCARVFEHLRKKTNRTWATIPGDPWHPLFDCVFFPEHQSTGKYKVQGDEDSSLKRTRQNLCFVVQACPKWVCDSKATCPDPAKQSVSGLYSLRALVRALPWRAAEIWHHGRFALLNSNDCQVWMYEPILVTESGNTIQTLLSNENSPVNSVVTFPESDWRTWRLFRRDRGCVNRQSHDHAQIRALPLHTDNELSPMNSSHVQPYWSPTLCHK